MDFLRVSTNFVQAALTQQVEPVALDENTPPEGIVRESQTRLPNPCDRQISNRQLTLFSQGSGAVEFEVLAIVEVAFLIEVVVE